jgi:hypothetical protein
MYRCDVDLVTGNRRQHRIPLTIFAWRRPLAATQAQERLATSRAVSSVSKGKKPRLPQFLAADFS